MDLYTSRLGVSMNQNLPKVQHEAVENAAHAAGATKFGIGHCAFSSIESHKVVDKR